MGPSWGKTRLGVVAIFCAAALAMVGFHRFSGRAYSADPIPTFLVTDYCTGAVTAYAARSNGDVSPLAPAPTGLAEPEFVAIDASGKIYAANICNNTITIYAKGTKGDAAPTAIIGGSNTGLISPSGIALDSSRNIYVPDKGAGMVFVYSAGSDGNEAPTATISGSNKDLESIALDSSGNIYVTDINSVFVYSAVGSSTGTLNETPIAAISTTMTTGLTAPRGIALDSSGKIYVGDCPACFGVYGEAGVAPSVFVYPAGSNANVAPIAAISGSSTGLIQPAGVAVDSSGKIYVADNGDPEAFPATAAKVIVYPKLGRRIGPINKAPIATITGSKTGLSFGIRIALDSSGNIYVAEFYSGTVLVYSAGSTGNVAPTAILTGPNTGLRAPYGIAFDSSGNIYVADLYAASVLVYPPLGSSTRPVNIAPIATISGPDTGLYGPDGIALDSIGNIYVADEGNPYNGIPPSVFAYPALGGSGWIAGPPATYSVAPTATISGPVTELFDPQFIAIQPPATPISEKLTISPSSTAFGDKVKVGTTSKAKTVTIENAGKKKTGLAVTIESESASPPVFAVKSECKETLEPGKSCKVSVTFTPADTTRQTGSLKIVDNVIGEPQSVGLSGTGKAAKKK